MRPVPFSLVALMGMDEHSFPGPVSPPGFDLIQHHPRPGDRQARQEAQYMFLESLLSARQQMIITYTGMGIRDNAPIPCAGVVSELMDRIQDSFRFESLACPPFYSHPLHPFHPVYFDQTSRFFSFSKSQCRIARHLAGPGAARSGSGTGVS